MSGLIRRRAFFPLALTFATGAAVGGCGFRPVYAPGPGGSAGGAQTDLAAISVGIIPNRQGQLLRQALQERFERGGVGIAHRYDLAVSVGFSGEGIAVQQNASVTRIRVIGTAIWSLNGPSAVAGPLTSGTVRSVDGYDIINNQFFAADMNNEDVNRRMADALADQITFALAAWFRARPA